MTSKALSADRTFTDTESHIVGAATAKARGATELVVAEAGVLNVITIRHSSHIKCSKTILQC